MPETETPVAAQPAPHVVDLDSRPAPDWLDKVQGEIDDVDQVLKCLARDSGARCAICVTATADGTLDEHPMLARCASTKT